VQIRANSADGVVVLDELAWVRGPNGDVSLYIGHVSRLIRFLRDPAARNRFPPAVEHALHAAEATHQAWRREVEPLFDASFLEAIEAPVRIVLKASGQVRIAEHVFGASWPQLRAGLRRLGSDLAAGSPANSSAGVSGVSNDSMDLEPANGAHANGSSGDGKTSIEQFVQACEHAASWLRVPFGVEHPASRSDQESSR
jgi:hypothetical protein